MEIDPRHGDYLAGQSVQHAGCTELPDAELVFTKNFLHDLVVIHSAEGARDWPCARPWYMQRQRAMEAMVARAKPGVKEYELKAAAASAIIDGGGDIDFLIIGSTPMDDPALIFGNPRPSSRMLKMGDMIEYGKLAAYAIAATTAQIGSPITVGPPTEMVRKFWEEITLPGYNKIMAEMLPGKYVEAMREAGDFFREKGVQSRPIHCHGIDIVTDNPHIAADHIGGSADDMIIKPGMIITAEPNPITADGMFGIFLGHTYIINEGGPGDRRRPVPVRDRHSGIIRTGADQRGPESKAATVARVRDRACHSAGFFLIVRFRRCASISGSAVTTPRKDAGAR